MLSFRIYKVQTKLFTIGLLALAFCLTVPSFAQTFSVEIPVTSGTAEVTQTIAADMDNDGDIDIISTSISDTKLAWYENLGSGSFDLQKIVDPSIENAYALEIADINGDGLNDILTSSTNDSTIFYYPNLGSGNFGTQVEIADIYSKYLHFGDVDGDGQNDLLLSHTENDKIKWSRNLGGAVFGSVQVLPIFPTSPKQLQRADLDGDGDAEIIALLLNQIVVYMNTGSGIYSPTSPMYFTNINDSFGLGDLDADGDLDIAVTSGFSTMWFENFGSGIFSALEIVALEDYAKQMALIDLNADGKLDFLTSSDGLSWIENLGGGLFGSAIEIPNAQSNNLTLEIGDLDNDGLQDVILGDRYSKTGWRQNLGGANLGNLSPIAAHVSFFETAITIDIDLDGWVDVLSLSRQLEWYPNLGGGDFGLPILIEDDINGSSLFAADLDGDGDPDVLTASSIEDEVLWYENLGAGTFAPPQLISNVGNGQTVVSAVDLDFDGDMDVLVANGIEGEIVWYENLSAGTFSTAQLVSGNATEPASLYPADLDQDGDIDVAAALVGKIVWYENLGSEIFDPAPKNIDGSLSIAESIIALDIDQDNDLDIISGSYWSSALYWYENLGSGSFAGATLIADDMHGITQIEAADLNDNGYPDIAVVSENDDGVVWFENLAGAGFGAMQIVSTTAIGPRSVGLADFDGDGAIDILSGSSNDEKIAWYKNIPTCSNAPITLTQNYDAGVLNLDWKEVPEAVAYQVKINRSSPAPFISGKFNTTDNTFSITYPLPAASSYQWMVRAYCNPEVSSWSSAANFTIFGPGSDTTLLTPGPMHLAENKLDESENGLLATQQLLVYPSPASESIYIQHTFDKEATVEISNVTGAIVQRMKLAAGQYTQELTIAQWENGLYFIRINAQGESQIGHFLKEQ